MRPVDPILAVPLPGILCFGLSPPQEIGSDNGSMRCRHPHHYERPCHVFQRDYLFEGPVELGRLLGTYL